MRYDMKIFWGDSRLILLDPIICNIEKNVNFAHKEARKTIQPTRGQNYSH